MSLNGVNSGFSTYETGNVSSTKNTSDVSRAGKTGSDKTAASGYSDVAATYEHSSKSQNAVSSSSRKASNASVVAQLKADQEARMAQMQSLVTKMFSKQGITIGTADDMWSFLAKGDFTVDAETKAQAEKDIAEDGYWGVEQTSDRIVEFAKALSGNDKEKAQLMIDAFKKGFQEATKTWGKELPDISQRTYDAVIQKLQDWGEITDDTATDSDLS